MSYALTSTDADFPLPPVYRDEGWRERPMDFGRFIRHHVASDGPDTSRMVDTAGLAAPDFDRVVDMVADLHHEHGDAYPAIARALAWAHHAGWTQRTVARHGAPHLHREADAWDALAARLTGMEAAVRHGF